MITVESDRPSGFEKGTIFTKMMDLLVKMAGGDEKFEIAQACNATDECRGHDWVSIVGDQDSEIEWIHQRREINETFGDGPAVAVHIPDCCAFVLFVIEK